MTDPGHAHSVYDPSHSHPVYAPIGSNGVGSGGGIAVAAAEVGDTGRMTAMSAPTNVSIYGGYTGLSIVAAGIGENRPRNLSLGAFIRF